MGRARRRLPAAGRPGAVSESYGALFAVRCAQSVRAEWDLLQGQPAAARARLTPQLRGPTLEEWGLNLVAPIPAWAHLEAGYVAEATAVLAQAMATAQSRADRLTLVDLLRVQAMVATRQRCWAEAEQALEEGLSLACSMPHPYSEARLLHIYGEMHVHKGEMGPARERLEAALAIFRRLGARKDASGASRPSPSCSPTTEDGGCRLFPA